MESHYFLYDSIIPETEFQDIGVEDEVIHLSSTSDVKEEDEVIVIHSDDDDVDVAPVRDKNVIIVLESEEDSLIGSKENGSFEDVEGEITSQNTSSKPPHLAFTTISNVKLHVPVQLILSQPNYKKWSRLFLLLVRRFNLKGYIDGSVVPLSDDDDEWFQLDALLQGWILSIITDEVSDLVISSVSTASALWKVIHDLFHDNKHARAMQLEHEFRTTVKGNSTMAAYCQQLQNLADWLDDVDAPVSQHQLVLQMLRGLPADLQGQTSFLQFQDPMPTFLQKEEEECRGG
ncbi:unnamed protein product [Cuscuta campestris]|uniref:Retrotransposon Copia-like N-terminal domain-containing protein n=1 Tax=Cuscuta campestris TaxID=132261 RepID=A0A484K244_9ASTE|nr:unnamed protein product [Cuscuta campestris]